MSVAPVQPGMDDLADRTYRCEECSKTHEDNVPSLVGWCPHCEQLTRRTPC